MTVPIARNRPLRKEAPRPVWATIPAEVAAQYGSSSWSQNAVYRARQTDAHSRRPKRTAAPSARRASVCGDRTADHLARIDDLIELLLVYIAGPDSSLLETQIFVVCLVSNSGRLVVSDHGAQGRHQHERALHVLGDLLAVRHRTFHQVLAEARAAIGQNDDRL